MRLDVRAFALAMTVAAAILYVVCAFFVAFMPRAALSLAGYAFHAELSGIMRPVSVSGFVTGLLVISISWGLLSLIMVSACNGLTKNGASHRNRETE